MSKTAVFGAENLPQGTGVPRPTDEPAPQIVPRRLRAGNQPSARKSANQKPWTNSRFWILQFIILALYLIRLAATVTFHLDATSPAVEFSTVELFVVPVIYGTLNYGLDGALLTAGWVTMLAVPRFLTALVSHNYVAAWAELAQVVLLDALAALVGQRVSSEQDARRIAESAQEAHQRAETLYRDLFYSNQAPILIVDGNGYVVETNLSAQRTFAPSTNRGRATGLPVRLVDVIGPVASSHILTRLISARLPLSAGQDDESGDADLVEPVAFEVQGHPALYRPSATMLGGSGDGTRMQIVFEDVTAETRRHDLMEAFAARVVSGQEEERRHIAQEIHDGPVQSLIHLCRQIDSMDAVSDPTHGGLRPSELRAIAEDTVAELRSIAKGLRPSILDDLGLVASINQILTEAGERQQFKSSFGVTGDERRLRPTVELALFRIAQEAISNIERHAEAQRVAVGLNFDQQGVRLLVRDDGVGFETRADSGGAGESLGLPGMSERARLIQSKLRIHSSKGGGTTVDVWVPTTNLADS